MIDNYCPTHQEYLDNYASGILKFTTFIRAVSKDKIWSHDQFEFSLAQIEKNKFLLQYFIVGKKSFLLSFLPSCLKCPSVNSTVIILFNVIPPPF
jgi:hypothetical protein